MEKAGEGNTARYRRKFYEEYLPRCRYQDKYTTGQREHFYSPVVVGFIRTGSSGALISFDTTDFHIEGKEGSWLAYDSIIVDGKEFFLMEHTTYGASAANVVLDADGKLVVDHVRNGFDETVQKQIKEYLHPIPFLPEPEKPTGQRLETWQKYYENGEYLQSAEITEEQNYNQIDGRINNLPPKPRKIGKRISP